MPIVPSTQRALAEIMPDWPASPAEATEMAMAAIGQFKRSILRQAVIVAYAKRELFHSANGWAEWCAQVLDYQKRFAISLWHAGEVLLGNVHHPALMDCSIEKLEELAKLNEQQLKQFLQHNDPAKMSRTQVRDKVADYTCPTDTIPGTELSEEDTPKFPRGEGGQADAWLKRIDKLSQMTDDDKLLVGELLPSASAMQAACNLIDLVLHQLSIEPHWTPDDFRKWRGPLQQSMELFEELEMRAQRAEHVEE